jgi:putative Holliday junction resolvase
VGGVLAIDYGEKKCGFASTDRLRIAREPLGVLRHEGRMEVLFGHLERLLGERDVSALVVGVPLDAAGAGGPAAERVRRFVEHLRARFPGFPVHEWNEHLTSKEAEARLRAAGRTGRAIRAERDSWSALVLLEDWLQSN